MKYPKCLSERETIELALNGMCLARYGDGEFNIAMGRHCISQVYHPQLGMELRMVLQNNIPNVLVGLPDPYGGTPKKANWQKFENWNLGVGKGVFGSAFITRPDSAPWIDTAEYWDRVRDFWRGRDVILVKGTERSLRVDMMTDAASVQCIEGTARDSYSVIDRIEAEIGLTAKRVLICLGPAATVLAARLARKNVHAIDLGHLGMMMRHAGAYRFKIGDLISVQYRDLLQLMYRTQDWGGSGHKQAKAVSAFAADLGADAILDYGSGKGMLAKALAPRAIDEWDPGAAVGPPLPKPTQLLVCTDVLEHVEPDKLDNVLTHIQCLAGKGVYLTVATRPANKNLPDGRNAHLQIEPPEFWLDHIARKGWTHAKLPNIIAGHSVTMWLKR